MHVPGKKNVADHLSRIPGAERLSASNLCTAHTTLGVRHICDTQDASQAPRRSYAEVCATPAAQTQPR